MHIKKLNINNYKKIQALLINNSSQLPAFRSWKLLNNLTNKNSSLIIDGLFCNGKLVGYHSSILKKIIFKKKFFKILVSSNWNVKKKFRNSSLALLNKFFKLKSDFYLTTTANNKVSKIWRALGAHEINSDSCKMTLFQITNYNNLLNYFFVKRQIYFAPKLLINFAKIILKIIFFYKNLNSSNNAIKFKKIEKHSIELEKFNILFELETKFPLEQRSKYFLSRYINILELNNKKSFIYQILKDEIMIGYIVLVGERHNGLKRMFLADFKIIHKYNFFINNILSFAIKISKDNNFSIIYFKNLPPNILTHVNKRFFFIKKYDFNPYLIKIGSKKANKLKFFFKTSWGTSYLDGDCLL